jgi:hypothetical protein
VQCSHNTRIQGIQSCGAQVLMTRFQQGLQLLLFSGQLNSGSQLGVLCHNQLVVSIMVTDHNISIYNYFRDSTKCHQPILAGRRVDARLSRRLSSSCAPTRHLSNDEPQFRTGPDQNLAVLPDPHWLLHSCCLMPSSGFDFWKLCLELQPCGFYHCLCNLYVQS